MEAAISSHMMGTNVTSKLPKHWLPSQTKGYMSHNVGHVGGPIMCIDMRIHLDLPH